MIYFTADLHLGHENIMHLCNRQFNNIEEHDEYILQSINNVCTENDNLYILGDIGYPKDINKLRDYLKRINANVYVVLGNHDSRYNLMQLKREGIIKDVSDFAKVANEGKLIVCCHYPLKEWVGYYRGSYLAYGHTHGNIKQYDRCMDVGVDNIGYTPIEFNELIERIDNNQSETERRVSDTDEEINKFFPNLNTGYFVNLCLNNEEIRNTIYKVLTNGVNNQYD